MARKNNTADGDDKGAHGFRLPRIDQQPLDFVKTSDTGPLKHSARKALAPKSRDSEREKSNIEQSKQKDDNQTSAFAKQTSDPTTTKAVARPNAATRHVRLLPAVNSLATQKKPTSLYDPSFPSSDNRTKLARSSRATPARRAKTNTRAPLPLDTDSDSDSEKETSSSSSSEDEVWADARSDPDSSFAGSAELDSSPIRWPSERLQPKTSPSKQQKAAQTKGLDQLVLDISSLRLSPSSDSAKENIRPTTPPAQRTTPPLSPSKSRLQSPSKRPARPATPPGRPSLDAFWDAGHINAWNEAYSPTKPIRSPTKLPPASPSKPPTSPRKSKSEIAAQRDFDTRKISLASSFLTELDNKICSGAISTATASTGGVKLIWSSTLNTTAGRATWKRTTLSSSSSSSSSSSGKEIQQHATIELAAKILTTEERLRNTLAHEFCHLATYIVSGVTTRPHGREFKAWGRKCGEVFGALGVEVTTRHSYEVEWRYVWACVGPKEEEEGGCGTTYGRHSKSLDPGRVRCGLCKGRLEQVKPVPRKGGKEFKKGEKAVGGFAGFVKENFAEARRELVAAGCEGVAHGAVMEELGRRWRVRKAEAKDVQQVVKGEKDKEGEDDDGVAQLDDDRDLDNVVRGLEVIVIDD